MLRFLLAYSVVMSHLGGFYGYYVIGGDLAVQCFFMISGFYMTMILGEKYPLNKAGILRFYKNRLLRLYPAYWFLIGCCVILAAWSGSTYFLPVPMLEKIAEVMPVWQSAWLVLANLFMVGLDTFMYLAVSPDGHLYWTANVNGEAFGGFRFYLISPAWSLPLELTFYAMAPFLVRRAWYWIVGLCSLSLVVRLTLESQGYSADPWTGRFFPNELMLFGIGILLHKFYRFYGPRMTQMQGFGAFLAVVAFFFGYSQLSVEPTILHWLFVAVFACAIPFVFHLTKEVRWDRALGELSYPLYLCHTFVQQLISFTIGPNPDSVLIVSAIAIAFAYAIHRFLEQPVERWRRYPVPFAEAARP